MKNPTLARTFRELGQYGKTAFYTGRIAEALIKACRDRGGLLTLEDLKNHLDLESDLVNPISIRLGASPASTSVSAGAFVAGLFNTRSRRSETQTRNNIDAVDVWEHPPNGQGIVALMALGILEQLETDGRIQRFTPRNHNSAQSLHAIIEALRIAFADAYWWVSDTEHHNIPIEELLSKEYLAERSRLFDPARASRNITHGSPAQQHCDTVYFAVTDKWGNGISFINSNYDGFGTKIIPKGCGFSLQNRGANFVFQEGHPNVFAPGKRPYHTIIPAMVTNASDGSLHTVYGVMGGFMQPQGHVQVLLNMLQFQMNPQVALDAPRVCIFDGVVYLEDGIGVSVRDELRRMGHVADIMVGHNRAVFGRGQVIRCHREGDSIVYSAGSDLRGDGAAYPV